MPAFRQGDIVKVPFPHTDRPARQFRPALVISAEDDAAQGGFVWVLMITSAANRGWPGDVPVSASQATGLPVPSVVRTAKIATIEAADASILGRAPAPVRRRALDLVARRLGLGAAE
jgi:mRNA interferase MazF